jgi:hypothetical protein
MAIQTKSLAANTGVTVLIEDNGKEYARIVSGALDGGQPVSIPTPATHYGKYKYNTDYDYKVDDADILTDTGGVAYWGVTDKRRK